MTQILKELDKFPRVYHNDLYRNISDLLIKKKNLSSFTIFLFNFKSLTGVKNIFKNLTVLSIDIIVIDKISDLNLLNSAINIKSLTINEIIISSNPTGMRTLSRCNFYNTIDDINTEEQLANLNLDFENDYIEVFIGILSKMKEITNLSFGSFSDKEILKLISLYCKNLISLKLCTHLILDENLSDILNLCTSITCLDLRGCGYIEGNCFLNIDPLPSELKRIKLSLANYNFYNLTNYLQSKGIVAENYIMQLN